MCGTMNASCSGRIQRLQRPKCKVILSIMFFVPLCFSPILVGSRTIGSLLEVPQALMVIGEALERFESGARLNVITGFEKEKKADGLESTVQEEEGISERGTDRRSLRKRRSHNKDAENSSGGDKTSGGGKGGGGQTTDLLENLEFIHSKLKKSSTKSHNSDGNNSNDQKPEGNGHSKTQQSKSTEKSSNSGNGASSPSSSRPAPTVNVNQPSTPHSYQNGKTGSNESTKGHINSTPSFVSSTPSSTPHPATVLILASAPTSILSTTSLPSTSISEKDSDAANTHFPSTKSPEQSLVTKPPPESHQSHHEDPTLLPEMLPPSPETKTVSSTVIVSGNNSQAGKSTNHPQMSIGTWRKQFLVQVHCQHFSNSSKLPPPLKNQIFSAHDIECSACHMQDNQLNDTLFFDDYTWLYHQACNNKTHSHYMLSKESHGHGNHTMKDGRTNLGQLDPELAQDINSGTITFQDLAPICFQCNPRHNFTTLSKVSIECQRAIFGPLPLLHRPPRLFENANAEKVDWQSLTPLEMHCYTNGGNITHGIKLGPGAIPDRDGLWKAGGSVGVVFAVLLGMWIVFLVEERLQWWLADVYDAPG